MNLGLRIRQARLEAGFSQRELCGEEITRNMLSLIEHGSARPSMDTLQYLARRLQKPVSYFLEEDTPVSPNQACMDRARQARPREALEILEQYRAPDPVFDREKYLLQALCAMELAREALSQQKLPYCRTLLGQAWQAGEQSVYFTSALKRQWVLLAGQAELEPPAALTARLPDCREELLLRAGAYLQSGDFSAALRQLEAVESPDPRWHRYMARAFMGQKAWTDAATHLLACGESEDTDRDLEICFREQGDFEKAYFYACRQRERYKFHLAGKNGKCSLFSTNHANIIE